MPNAEKIFTPPPKRAPKVTVAVRLTPEAKTILDGLVAVYESSNGHVIEAMLNAYGPSAIEQAKNK